MKRMNTDFSGKGAASFTIRLYGWFGSDHEARCGYRRQASHSRDAGYGRDDRRVGGVGPDIRRDSGGLTLS